MSLSIAQIPAAIVIRILPDKHHEIFRGRNTGFDVDDILFMNLTQRVSERYAHFKLDFRKTPLAENKNLEKPNPTR